MLSFMRFGRQMAYIATIALVAAPSLAGVTTAATKAEQVPDVTISDRGNLVGQVLNESGKPQANTNVVAFSNSKIVSKTKTDARGVFQLPVRSAGAYTIVLGEQQFAVRAWQAKLAPPAAKPAILYVTKASTVRGQLGGGGASTLTTILTNPLFIGAGVAAGIAIPVAMNDDDDPPAPSVAPPAS